MEDACFQNILFLYSEDCPSHEDALTRLRRIMIEEQVYAEVEIIRVDTHEQAVAHRFRGSPTILIDGKDVDPTSTEEFGLACRVYRSEDGRYSPLPPESMIRRAIREAKRKQLKSKR